MRTFALVFELASYALKVTTREVQDTVLPFIATVWAIIVYVWCTIATTWDTRASMQDVSNTA